ncbi:MAG: hypothetical protein ACTHN0_07515 [Aquihabitans sp.]
MTDQFFDRLDALLPYERTVRGGCSAADFLGVEIPYVVDALADDLHGVTIQLADEPDIRVAVAAGRLVPAFMVYAELLDDGSVEVFWLDIE